MITINGVNVATPKIFKIDINDIDGESNRNANGQLIRDRIAVKRKLSCEWAPLEMSEISTLLQAVKDVYFQVNYPDPQEGQNITKTFYVGNRTAPVLDCTDGRIMLWQGLTMDFIEQ